MKFSIIIPVYNVEKYIVKCIESVINQTYKNYEIIIVNDGTKDKSINLIKNYNITLINQKNQGLSVARNNGIKKATGDYILFLDSDDYLEPELFEKLNENITNKPDLVRFQIQEVSENNKITKYNEKSFSNLSGQDGFKIISTYHFVENAWCYLINKNFMIDNNFEFKKGTIHEDFGLIPLMLISAKKVNSISFIGYNYLQRNGSIMSINDYDKTKKKVDDFYNHYLYLEKEGKKRNLATKEYLSFISNSLILKITTLNKKDYKKILKNLKKDKVFNNLMTDTISRKIKKILVSISPKIYYKIKGD